MSRSARRWRAASIGVALAALLGTAGGLALAPVAQASTALDLSGCRETALHRNDDESSASVPLPFRVNFYGTDYESLFVNNNGNVTFDAPLGDYVPFDLTQTDRAIIAPFFADVDTRPADGGTVTYGETAYDGRPAFCVLWDEVGYFSNKTDRRNTFQLLLVRRTPGTGDFDIVFRYAGVQWELGSASGGVPARAGFSNGNRANSVELAGSAQSGAFLDGGSHALSQGSVNSNSAGTWIFRVVGGVVGNDPRNVPPGLERSSAWWGWPDQDDDGLPDHWETNGVWVGERFVDLPAMGATPGPKDAFVYVDVVQGERWNSTIEDLLRSSFARSPLAIRLHVIRGARALQRSEVPTRVNQSDAFFSSMVRLGFSDTGLAGSPGSVPALAKYVCACPDYYGEDAESVNENIGGFANGIKADHLIVTMYEARWIGEVEQATGLRFSNDGLVGDRLNAVTAMHELGHLYGLRHHGKEDEPDDHPDYRSIMSYAYSAFGVPQSAGDGGATGDIFPRIDFSRRDAVNFDWKMGEGFGELSLVYGQHAERGDFYNSVGEIAKGLGEAPLEADIDELLADPTTREQITQGARALEEAVVRSRPAAQPTPAQPTPAPTPNRVDRTKPTAKITKITVGKLKGAGKRARALASIRFTAIDDLTPTNRLIVRCKVDRRRFVPCRSRQPYTRLKRGRHTFTLLVIDAAGNRAIAKRSFVVKAPKPRRSGGGKP